MSLTLAIAVIVLADVALLAGLSYVMSRAKLLTPHLSQQPSIAEQQSLAPKHRPAPARASAGRPRARATVNPVEA